MIGLLAWGVAVSGQQFAGTHACAKCHPAQALQHSKTGHARSLSLLRDHPLRPSFPSAVTGEWAFGAGTQAVTFVGRDGEDFYVEHGLSFYRATGQLALTPGHRDAKGERYRTLDPAASILRCFQCHSTGTLRLTGDFAIAPAEPGVQCEACHGAGADHGAIRNPRKMDAAQVNELCGACHRQPPVAGADTEWTNAWNVRHQPVYLSQSACFLKGKASCLTCHPAHTAAVRKDEACAGCHASPKHRTVTVARSGCVGCHMPKVRPSAELAFTNHWIGVYWPGSSLRPR